MTASVAVDYVRGMEHGVLVAVGSGKQGKSCSLHSLLALALPDRPKYLVDPAAYDVGIFPGYRKVGRAAEVPVGAVAIIEDVNRVFHSRGSGKDPTLQQWLGIISHKSIVVAVTTQTMADTDVAFLRSQDAVVLHKYMHAEDLDFERPEFRTAQAVADVRILRCAREHPETDRRAWCFFPRFNELAAIPSVPWWTYANSHMLREASI